MGMREAFTAGSMPPIMAMVVMMIGRARLRPASTMASARGTPRFDRCVSREIANRRRIAAKEREIVQV